MEMSIRTIMVIVIGLIAALLMLTIFASGTSQGSSMLDGIFDWFKILGGGGAS